MVHKRIDIEFFAIYWYMLQYQRHKEDVLVVQCSIVVFFASLVQTTMNGKKIFVIIQSSN